MFIITTNSIHFFTLKSPVEAVCHGHGDDVLLLERLGLLLDHEPQGDGGRRIGSLVLLLSLLVQFLLLLLVLRYQLPEVWG